MIIVEPHLRRPRIEDAPAVLAAFTSDPDMVRQGDIATLVQAHSYVQRLVSAGSCQEPWAIVERDRLVGLVCIGVDEENRNGWFWYWMNASARHRGWASRAAATVADWALFEHGLDRLELGHRMNNPASGRVAAAAGFVPEGTERGKFLIDGERIDVRTYGRLRSDPRPVVEPFPMCSESP